MSANQKVKAAIQRFEQLNSAIQDHENFIARLEQLMDKPHRKCDGYIKLFDSAGNNPASIRAEYLVRRPELLHQSLYNNLVELIEERDRLEEVFSVTDRLLKP